MPVVPGKCFAKAFIQDKYDIVVEADFETHVPMPVVVIDPIDVDLTPFENGIQGDFYRM